MSRKIPKVEKILRQLVRFEEKGKEAGNLLIVNLYL
jgi:hypothetical protein